MHIHFQFICCLCSTHTVLLIYPSSVGAQVVRTLSCDKEVATPNVASFMIILLVSQGQAGDISLAYCPFLPQLSSVVLCIVGIGNKSHGNNLRKLED